MINYYYITKLALIVSDEEVKDFALGYHSETNEIEKIYDSNNYKTKPFKVIAGIPELPSINHSKLSPEEQNRLGWIDVDELAENAVFHILDDVERKIGFKEGLTHQLSIKRYTEEELLHSLKVAFTSGFEHSRLANNPMNMFVDNYIKSLNQPELIPIEIETEDWRAAGEGGLGYKTQIPRPKITNNQVTITKIL